MSLSLITYSVLLVIYVVVMWLTPARDPAPGDKKIQGEEQFIQLAILLNLVWWFSLTLPFYTPAFSMLDQTWAAVVGTTLFGLGMLVRTVAIRTLGNYFTYKLTIRQEHHLVKHGIYRYLRHPSYTGTLLEVIGMMVAARSLFGLLLFLASAGTIIGIRIRREERMLCESFGEPYKEYMKSSKRLIPFLF